MVKQSAFLIVWTMSACATTHYYSSTINQQYSCSAPLLLNDAIIIHLDEDMIFNECLPFIAGPSFHAQHTITFTSTNGKKCIVNPHVVIDLRPICTNGQAIIVAGTAQWFFKRGSKLIFNDNEFKIIENGMLIFENEES